jgi:Uma2 family endonuclease
MSTLSPVQPFTVPIVFASPFVYRMTVEEYERIGPMLDDPRVELVDGYLVRMMTKSPEHSFSTIEVHKAVESLLPAGWIARPEQPVRIPGYDEPEPDVTVVRGHNADYRHRMPTAADLALAIEVSDSTLSLDRGKKLTAYANNGVPIYWIVNLAERQVEVYTDPGPAAYQSCAVFKPGQDVPVVINGQPCGSVRVDDILP